jgi:hypothetical protein
VACGRSVRGQQAPRSPVRAAILPIRLLVHRQPSLSRPHPALSALIHSCLMPNQTPATASHRTTHRRRRITPSRRRRCQELPKASAVLPHTPHTPRDPSRPRSRSRSRLRPASRVLPASPDLPALHPHQNHPTHASQSRNPERDRPQRQTASQRQTAPDGITHEL